MQPSSRSQGEADPPVPVPVTYGERTKMIVLKWVLVVIIVHSALSNAYKAAKPAADKLPEPQHRAIAAIVDLALVYWILEVM